MCVGRWRSDREKPNTMPSKPSWEWGLIPTVRSNRPNYKDWWIITRLVAFIRLFYFFCLIALLSVVFHNRFIKSVPTFCILSPETFDAEVGQWNLLYIRGKWLRFFFFSVLRSLGEMEKKLSHNLPQKSFCGTLNAVGIIYKEEKTTFWIQTSFFLIERDDERKKYDRLDLCKKKIIILFLRLRNICRIGYTETWNVLQVPGARGDLKGPE